jgi:hypothetical protein
LYESAVERLKKRDAVTTRAEAVRVAKELAKAARKRKKEEVDERKRVKKAKQAQQMDMKQS